MAAAVQCRGWLHLEALEGGSTAIPSGQGEVFRRPAVVGNIGFVTAEVGEEGIRRWLFG